MPAGKRKPEPGPAARSPKKKPKTTASRSNASTKSSSKSSQKPAGLLENRSFKIWDPANPLAGTVVDDLLPQVEDEIRSSSGRSERQQRRQEESDREHSTILIDDDDILDVPNLPFTVQWCTIFLLKDEDGKQIDKDA